MLKLPLFVCVPLNANERVLWPTFKKKGRSFKNSCFCNRKTGQSNETLLQSVTHILKS